ncbi:MAG: nickel transporter [Planctomycetota bacterium]
MILSVLAHGGHDHASSLAASAPLLAGVIAGVAHVVTGPDHLAAVAPLAVEQRQRTWLAGTLWGLGHSGGVWLLAILAITLREALPLDAISSWSERFVGVVLIGVGLWGVHRVLRLRVHTHQHTHVGPDGTQHTHEHVHAHAASTGTDHEHKAHAHSHGALGIGALHGIAGTSHLIGVLPALAMPTRTASVLYVIAFGLGSIAGMGLFTGLLGMLTRAADQTGRAITKMLLGTSSIAALFIGTFWIISA